MQPTQTVRRARRATAAALLAVVLGAGSAGALPPSPECSRPTLAPLLEATLPGVVEIEIVGDAVSADQAEDAKDSRIIGAGVVFDAARGYVVTSSRLVSMPGTLTVVLADGRRVSAKTVGTDPDTDVAVVRIVADRLTALPFGRSDTLRVGDYVVAVGNAFGLGVSATAGIVGALARSGLGTGGIEEYIQTDASMNAGNAGGALIDMDGRLVGILSAMMSAAGANVGVGFAVPAEIAQPVAAELVAHGAVDRPRLGVAVADVEINPTEVLQQPPERGARVVEVDPGSAAATAGMKIGDVVLMVDGRPVATSQDLKNRIGLLHPGDQVTISFRRKKHLEKVRITLPVASQFTARPVPRSLLRSSPKLSDVSMRT